MAETYYIRLPFYLVGGETVRTADIIFDNDLISNAEISATSRTAMNNVNISVTKEPGIYTLKIKPVIGADPEEGFSSVCLDDVWVSNDNVNFYSVILNYNPAKNPLVKSPSDESYGFDPYKGGIMYNNVEFSVEINLPDSANWSKLYEMANADAIKASYDQISVDGTAEQKANLPKMLAAYEFFKARGY